MSRPPRKMPKNFAEIAAAGYVSDHAARFKVGKDTVRRWCADVGVAVKEPPYKRSNAKPVPDDFMDVAPTMCGSDLMRHYGLKCRKTYNRWLRLSGARPGTYQPVAPPSPQRSYRNNYGAPHIPRIEKMHTVEDCAADILRRERYVVYRCDDRGRYEEKGKFWRIGNTLATGPQLMARADKYRSRAA